MAASNIAENLFSSNAIRKIISPPDDDDNDDDDEAEEELKSQQSG
jgi:hypothetical protein